MATLRELIVRVSADTATYQSELDRASRMGANYYKTMEGSSRRMDAALRQNQQSLNKISNELVSLKMGAVGFASALAGSFAVSSILDAADDWSLYASRLKMAAGESENLAAIQDRLFEVSNRNQKPIAESYELYIRSASAMRELGYSTEGTLNFLESFSSSLTVNAASAERGQRAIDAISKSMVTGKISGNEFKAIMDVIPTSLKNVADYLTKVGKGAKVTESDVKRMALSGKLSMVDFANAMNNARLENNRLADEMPVTIRDAVTQLKNNWQKYIGETNQAIGVTATVSDGIRFLAGHIEDVANAGMILAAGGLVRYFTNLGVSAGGAAVKVFEAQEAKVALASAQLAAAKAAELEATATYRRAAAEAAATANTRGGIVARIAMVQARQAEQVAIQGTIAAQTRLNAVTGIGRGVMGMLGGPAGVASLAATGIAMFAANAMMAKSPTEELSERVRYLTSDLKELQLQEINKGIEDLNKLITDYENRKKSLDVALAIGADVPSAATMKKYNDAVAEQLSGLEKLKKRKEEIEKGSAPPKPPVFSGFSGGRDNSKNKAEQKNYRLSESINL